LASTSHGEIGIAVRQRPDAVVGEHHDCLNREGMALPGVAKRGTRIRFGVLRQQLQSAFGQLTVKKVVPPGQDRSAADRSRAARPDRSHNPTERHEYRALFRARSMTAASAACVRRATAVGWSECTLQAAREPYFQYFCGEAVLWHELPFGRSSLTLWSTAGRGAAHGTAGAARIHRLLKPAAATSRHKVRISPVTGTLD